MPSTVHSKSSFMMAAPAWPAHARPACRHPAAAAGIRPSLANGNPRASKRSPWRTRPPPAPAGARQLRGDNRGKRRRHGKNPAQDSSPGIFCNTTHQRPAQPVQIHGQRRASQNHCPSAPMPCVRKRCSTTAKVSSVSQKGQAPAPARRQTLRMRQQAALYRAWRKFTTKVVSQITGSAAPAAIKLTATNCEEPANTTPTKPSAPGRQPGADRQCAKITPNGAAPPASAWCRARPAKTPRPEKPCLLPVQNPAAILPPSAEKSLNDLAHSRRAPAKAYYPAGCAAPATHADNPGVTPAWRRNARVRCGWSASQLTGHLADRRPAPATPWRAPPAADCARPRAASQSAGENCGLNATATAPPPRPIPARDTGSARRSARICRARSTAVCARAGACSRTLICRRKTWPNTVYKADSRVSGRPPRLAADAKYQLARQGRIDNHRLPKIRRHRPPGHLAGQALQ